MKLNHSGIPTPKTAVTQPLAIEHTVPRVLQSGPTDSRESPLATQLADSFAIDNPELKSKLVPHFVSPLQLQ
jgi:hypothetical protein